MTRAALAGLGAAVVALVLPAPAGAAPPEQPLVKLLLGHVARIAPDASAPRSLTVPGRRPLTGVRTVLVELGRATGPHGRAWVKVRLPGRPNGGTGWIKAARTRSVTTPWRLTVDLGTRRVTVVHYGRVVRRFAAVVGAPATPTPTGQFFVEEGLALSSAAPGGPFALATSARSDVLQEFEGGPGQIALHGRHHLAGALGTASSHGCVRLTSRAIRWLARRIGAGVPLTVRR